MNPRNWFLMCGLALPMIGVAQDPDGAGEAPEAAEAPAAEAGITDEDVLAVIELPGIAERGRQAGIPAAELAEVLQRAKANGLRATEMKALAESGSRAAREHGPVDNFGAFVTARLDEGLRGKELAAAIRAEHEAHGKGPVDRGEGKRGGKREGAGKDEDEAGKGAKGERKSDGEHGKGGGEAKGAGAKPEGERTKGEGKADGEHGKAGEAKGKADGEHGKAGEAKGKKGGQ